MRNVNGESNRLNLEFGNKVADRGPNTNQDLPVNTTFSTSHPKNKKKKEEKKEKKRKKNRKKKKDFIT